MFKYDRAKVWNNIIWDLGINVASCFQGVRRGLATKEASHPSTPPQMLKKDWGDFLWILYLIQLHYLPNTKKGRKKGAKRAQEGQL
jgi:hypothetical protein